MSESAAPYDPGPRPGDRNTTFFDDPAIDGLLHTLANVTMELSVTRERLESLELYVRSSPDFDEARLDALTASPDNQSARAARQSTLVRDVFGVLAAKLFGAK